ncbi:MAG: NADH-ubiquinone oxidoreductase-F iron-sulfur binding region domain-containing protein [Candidatus Dormibacteraceae bacterium]
MTNVRLLAGRDLAMGAETLGEHLHRLGPLPAAGRSLIDLVAASGLTGRGGADYPVGLKWRSIAVAPQGSAVIVVNGAEGEPRSRKDRLLMTTRPQLVLDGAFLAAKAVDAKRIVLYIGEDHHAARQSMYQALNERTDAERRMVRAVAAPARYVAGTSSAAVHLINAGIATPTSNPPAPHERGVDGDPTLVHNVETLAHVALLARTREVTGTLLITVVGGVVRPGVLEVDIGTTVAEVVEMAGGATEHSRAVLMGGYFGNWVDAYEAQGLPLDSRALSARGLSLGCGVIGLLPVSRCAVCEVAGIMRYLAGESAAQCGPCFFGLRALADACSRISEHGTNGDDLHRMQRWSGEVRGRGGCHHPDGAVMFLQSALRTFSGEFAQHPPHLRRSA